jgi:dTDP-3-amino-3,4,6-trideoxy-alpha-D-glucose transaminase
VVTGDAGLAQRLRLLLAHGTRAPYHHEVVGTIARLDAVQAAMLRVKLERLEGWNYARRRMATGIHYPVPIRKASAHAGRSAPALPVTEALARRILSLPIYPGMTDEEVAIVAGAVAGFRGV